MKNSMKMLFVLVLFNNGLACAAQTVRVKRSQQETAQIYKLKTQQFLDQQEARRQEAELKKTEELEKFTIQQENEQKIKAGEYAQEQGQEQEEEEKYSEEYFRLERKKAEKAQEEAAKVTFSIAAQEAAAVAQEKAAKKAKKAKKIAQKKAAEEAKRVAAENKANEYKKFAEESAKKEVKQNAKQKEYNLRSNIIDDLIIVFFKDNSDPFKRGIRQNVYNMFDSKSLSELKTLHDDYKKSSIFKFVKALSVGSKEEAIDIAQKAHRGISLFGPDYGYEDVLNASLYRNARDKIVKDDDLFEKKNQPQKELYLEAPLSIKLNQEKGTGIRILLGK